MKPDSGEQHVPVAALLCQEAHVHGEGLISLKAKAKKGGWKLSGAPGRPGEKGTGIVGAQIATPSHVGAGLAKFGKEDLSPEESPGRLGAIWVEGVVRGGILMISVYLWEGEGLTDRNRSILYAAGDAIKRHGGPWLIGGDFNTIPGDVAESMGDWLKKVGGGNLRTRRLDMQEPKWRTDH